MAQERCDGGGVGGGKFGFKHEFPLPARHPGRKSFVSIVRENS